MTGLAVSIEHRRVTDGRTDRQTSYESIVCAMHGTARKNNHTELIRAEVRMTTDGRRRLQCSDEVLQCCYI